MTDILSSFTLNNIHNLRGLSLACDVRKDQHLVDGVYLSWDDAKADVALHFHSEPGELFSIDAEITGAPRWVSLNFALGVGTLAQGQTICVVTDASSDAERAFPTFVRSTAADRLQDFHWDEQIKLTGQRRIVTALCRIPATESVVGECFHTLIIQLPKVNFRLSVYDLRLFRISSEQGVAPAPTTLASES